jgi:hypothetical protein
MCRKLKNDARVQTRVYPTVVVTPEPRMAPLFLKKNEFVLLNPYSTQCPRRSTQFVLIEKTKYYSYTDFGHLKPFFPVGF